MLYVYITNYMKFLLLQMKQNLPYKLTLKIFFRILSLIVKASIFNLDV